MREKSNLVILIKEELKKINQVLKKSDNWAKETLEGNMYNRYKLDSQKTRKQIQDANKKIKRVPPGADASMNEILTKVLSDIKNARLKYEFKMKDY